MSTKRYVFYTAICHFIENSFEVIYRSKHVSCLELVLYKTDYFLFSLRIFKDSGLTLNGTCEVPVTSVGLQSTLFLQMFEIFFL